MAKDRSFYYDYHQDWVGKQFKHLLDYYEGDGRERTTTPGSYVPIGSWANTPVENEDPTYHGFDFYINWWDSPLFNGTIDSFIASFSGFGNEEIFSRAGLLAEFKRQFIKFIKIDSPESATGFAGEMPRFLKKYSPKAYYLKSVKGLSNIIESSDPTKIKQFVDYPKDMIELYFYEDVAQSLGYLASLYKALSWSRINGKQAIPENLLRFDVTIVVTEARKMNRVVYDENKRSVEIYADKISNYEYKLYECQFFFPTLPHGDEVKNDTPAHITDYVVKFNYKFSTLKFNKMLPDLANYPYKQEFAIDNSQLDPFDMNPKNTNSAALVPSDNSRVANSTPEFPNNQNNATETARNVTNQALNTATTNSAPNTTTTNTNPNTVNQGSSFAGPGDELDFQALLAEAEGNTSVNPNLSNLGAIGSGVLAGSGLNNFDAGLLTGGVNSNNVTIPFENTSNFGGNQVNTNAGKPITATIQAQKKIIVDMKKYIRDDGSLSVVEIDDGGLLGEANRNESSKKDSSDEKNQDQIKNEKDGLENNKKSKETLANLERIGANAAKRVKQAQDNINALNNSPGGRNLASVNNFLNQSIAGQSPTLSRLGNRVLSEGRRVVRNEIFRQASLLDKSLAAIRFR